MTMEDSDPNSSSDHILDWLDGSISFLPSFLEDHYNSSEINGDDWWVNNQDFDYDVLNTSSTSGTSTTPSNPIVPNSPQLSDSSQKRKQLDDTSVPKPSLMPRKNHSRRYNEAEEGVVVVAKKSGGSKRQNAKTGGANCNKGNNTEGRWAEHLLNPCAAAIAAGNLTRVQHLLYVLHELASPTGDANHRLAAHGLKALTHHLSGSGVGGAANAGQITFTTTKPQTFQKSLMRFDEVSPYFMFPNKIANASILQILSEQGKNSVLHILDIGVSHGIQWPNLLEALTRRPVGAPPQVRLTIVGGSAAGDVPFATGPPGHSNSPQLLGFAKSMNLNLHIDRLENAHLQNLNTHIINSSPDEVLIVCAQFRLHHLSHQNPDQRSDLLKMIRELGPKGVILSENNYDCSCSNCTDFATGFTRKVEFLWRFLDSTSAAFKGRESDERRVMEGEAAKAMTSMSEMNEGIETWCERMRRCGFVEKGYGENAIDEARALLRKYDGGWEMRVEEKESGCVGLWWKSQPVSFCSLWEVGTESKQERLPS